jgi:hypothetical protein
MDDEYCPLCSTIGFALGGGLFVCISCCETFTEPDDDPPVMVSRLPNPPELLPAAA